MLELKQSVQKKSELEQQLLDLEAEQKKLKKEVFDLRITANNEQVDVDKLERFSVKGLFLQLSGRKEELLEQERREARHAKSQYDMATARLGSIALQMESIPAKLEELGSCEEELLEQIKEQLGMDPCPEQVQRVGLLRQVIDTAVRLREAGTQLNAAVDELYSWIHADRRSFMVSRKYHAAEVDAMTKQEIYQELLQQFKSLLEAAQLEMDTSGWQFFDKRYMEGMLFGQANRCMEVAEQVVRIDFQLKAALPKLENLLRHERIDLMNALIQLV